MLRHLRRVWLTSLLLGITLAGTGCNDSANTNATSSLLTLISLVAEGPNGEDGPVLASDVITIVDGVPTIIEDMGSATVRNTTINPDQGGPSAWQDVVLNRYRITYTRADGRNQPGLDVPYAFEAAMTDTVKINAELTFGFILVRAIAKRERPLVELAEGGIGEGTILTTATVEFWGNDLGGHPVYLKGQIAVHFANWADEG